MVYVLIFQNKKLIKTFVGHSDFIKAICVGKYKEELVIISGSSDKTIRIWNSDIDESIKTVKYHTRPVEDVKYFQDHLYSAASDSLIVKWDQNFDTPLMVFNGHHTTVYNLCLGDYMWSGSADKTVKKWNLDVSLFNNLLQNGKKIDEIELPDKVSHVSFHKNKLLVCCADTIWIYSDEV